MLLRVTSVATTAGLLLACCAATQVLFGAPFLATYPVAYVARAFELTRVFEHKWSVNFAFLPPHLFRSRELAAGLLALTLAGWAALALDSAAPPGAGVPPCLGRRLRAGVRFAPRSGGAGAALALRYCLQCTVLYFEWTALSNNPNRSINDNGTSEYPTYSSAW